MSEVLIEREDLESTIFNEKLMVQVLLFINEFKRYPSKDEITNFNAFPEVSQSNLAKAVEITCQKAKNNRFIFKDPITQEIFVSELAKNYLKPYH